MAIYLEFIERPLWWQIKGLQQTRTGYGGKLTTRYKALVGNREYRVYCMLYSNSGTLYILINGIMVIVDRYETS